jgi:hypothetical protein
MWGILDDGNSDRAIAVRYWPMRSILAGIQRTGYRGKALPCLGLAAGGVGSGVDRTARREQQRDPNFAAPTA